MSAFIRNGLWTYRSHLIEFRPLGGAPPLNLKWIVRKPLVGQVLHRARTLADARAWIRGQE